jgi:endo-1,4-beta-xylanase
MYNPEWLTNGNFNAEELESILKDHIENVITNIRLEDDGVLIKPLCWDVVNEAISDSDHSKPFVLKKADPWYPTLPNYIDIAFTHARKVDKEILLFYNDYSIVYNKNKRDAVYNMAKDMQNRNIPIDGIGLQMHV